MLKEKVKEIVNKLYEMEKKTNIMCKQGIEPYYKYWAETDQERSALITKLDKLLDKDMTFNEAQFKCFWQCGYIRNWNICKTKKRYIQTIKKYIELYGKPLEQDTIMYKAVAEEEELYGSSWTKHWQSACNFATKFGLGKIVSMVVPKGTKTIHIPPTFVFKESEDIIDTTEVMNGTLRNFAKFIDYRFIKERKAGIVVGEFEKIDKKTKYLHRLDARDSFQVIGSMLQFAA